MAHKAKPTRKTNTTPGTKSTPKTKANSKTKTTEKAKTTQKGNNEVASYAFTEPVIRILRGAAVKQSGPHQKIRSCHRQDADAKGDLTVFHKLEKKSYGTDVIGTRGLSTWKKSSGRSKSWANCRRLKIARDDLELLIRSKSRPVAFGWPFSTIITPLSFVRSHGMLFNRQSETKQKGLSRAQPFKDLEQKYDPEWPGHSFKAIARRQEIVFPVGVRFFCRTRATQMYTWSKIATRYPNSIMLMHSWMMVCPEIGHPFREGRWIDSGEVMVSVQKLFNSVGR